MRQVAKGKGAKAKATRLHAELVRSRGRCERCGSTYWLECAHIIRRGFSATRTDETNAWCLCSSCHGLLTAHRSEHMLLVDVTCGLAGFERLRVKAEAGVKADEAFWRGEVVRLTALLERAAA